MGPGDLAARETLCFLESVLPDRVRILEVGCGHGEVAAGLRERHFVLRALDSDAAAVGAAAARGADAVLADFLSYEDDPFDAIAFTRSLHHIHPLEAALDRARWLLKPGGLLVAEEFAREAVDRETARWFYAKASRLERAGLLAATDDLRSRASDPLERWRQDHMRERLNTGEEMRAGVAVRFDLIEIQEAPYLYRHFCGRLEESARGLREARALLSEETRGIEKGRFTAAGLRLVAARPPLIGSGSPPLRRQAAPAVRRPPRSTSRRGARS